jgi:hypothetical protein
MERQEVTVHPLLGYRLTVNPHEPDFVMVQFQTKADPFSFGQREKFWNNPAKPFGGSRHPVWMSSTTCNLTMTRSAFEAVSAAVLEEVDDAIVAE